MSVFIYR